MKTTLPFQVRAPGPESTENACPGAQTDVQIYNTFSVHQIKMKNSWNVGRIYVEYVENRLSFINNYA